MMRQRTHNAFTLVELLVVVGIIAMLIAVLMPALNKAREAAVSIQCLSNIRQVGMGLHQYGNLFGGAIPFTGFSFDPAYKDRYYREFVDGTLVPTKFVDDRVASCPKQYLYGEMIKSGTTWIYRAPQNQSVYGLPAMPQDRVTNYRDQFYMVGGTGSWGYQSGTDAPSRYWWLKLSKVKQADRYAILIDSSSRKPQYDWGCPMVHPRQVWAGGSWNSIAAWMAHGRASVCFADGHAASCGPNELLDCTNMCDLTGSPKKQGIRCWKDKNGNVVTVP